MKKLIKDNYCILIGLVIGALLSATVVYATGSFGSNNVYYKNNRSSLSSNNVQGAIDELASKIEEPTECPDGFSCVRRPQLGEYVSMTPTLTSATTDTAKNGYSSSQTFNPSELNLWRVISLNDDGTVDIISEYVSSTLVYFSGLTGYRNFVGYLNVLASKYENSTYTTGSRHFGYNGQTEYITADEDTYFSNSAPYASDTSDNTNESTGGGDTLYLTDYNLVNSVLGTTVATKPSGSTAYYWVASRYYDYTGSGSYGWFGRYVFTDGLVDFFSPYYYDYPTFSSSNLSTSLRPILTLKSGLTYSGAGTKDSPLELSVS